MKRRSAKVHNLTTERARRGRLPWTFTIDLGADRFRATLSPDARPIDMLAMADAADAWAKALRQAAKQLRRGAKPCPTT